MKEKGSVMNGEKIEQYLKMLSLGQIANIYQQEADNAVKTKLSYQEYLLRLLDRFLQKLTGQSTGAFRWPASHK